MAPEAKESARELAIEAVRNGAFGRREVVVRVNGLDTPWGVADMEAIAAICPDAVLAPKVSDAAEVGRYARVLAGRRPAPQLWAMIETARCVFHLNELAATGSTLGLSMLVVGTNDLAKELGAIPGVKRAPLIGVLGLAVAAARANGLGILDGVFNDLQDDAGFLEQCKQGLEFGFDGKTLVHPRQIEACNRVFAPAPEELAWAHAVLAAFGTEANRHKAVLQINGKLVERLHLQQAQRLLAIDAAIVALAEPRA